MTKKLIMCKCGELEKHIENNTGVGFNKKGELCLCYMDYKNGCVMVYTPMHYCPICFAKLEYEMIE